MVNNEDFEESETPNPDSDRDLITHNGDYLFIVFVENLLSDKMFISASRTSNMSIQKLKANENHTNVIFAVGVSHDPQI